ncbi:MAG: sugar ABC transporter permease [Subdoligranulum sp.]|nr:sugar ABC transporter permease [Subdoligranulum sp.]
MKGRLRALGQELKKNRALFLMILPAVLVVLIFSYLPMSGLVLAFKDYKFNLGIFKSPWHGLENFRFLFISGVGWKITINTILYNLLNLITSQGLAILIAIVLSEMKVIPCKKTAQSVIFFPYFISWVIVGTFVYNIFNYETGLMNSILTSIGSDPVNVYSMPWVWPIIICAFNAWKWCGYNSVVYIAAITGVDTECYEAAEIDGANIFQRIRHITLPAIKPTIITMLLLNVGRILRGDFEMFYQIVGNNGQLFNATDVIDTYVFRALTTSGNMGMTAAATLYQSVLCFVIIVTVNAIVRRVDPDNALF